MDVACLFRHFIVKVQRSINTRNNYNTFSLIRIIIHVYFKCLDKQEYKCTIASNRFT